MPLVNGFLIVNRETPSFVLPVFVEHHGSNHSLIQQIDDKDRVVSFLDMDVGNSYEVAREKPELEIGDAALWGFRSLDGEIILGIASQVSKVIRPRLQNGEYRDYPLIENQVAKFCKDKRTYMRALARSFKAIEERSPLMACIWRDSVILLPEAKAEIARTLPPNLLREMDNVRLLSDKNKIEIELPANIFNLHGQDKLLSKLGETESLGKAFGLSTLTFVRADSSKDTPNEVPYFDDAYGELESFTGIGDLVQGNSPYFRRINAPFSRRTTILLPPWIKTRSRPRHKPPLVSIFVLNTERGNIDSAQQAARKASRESIKIAVVTLPITFGTSKGPKVDLPDLAALQTNFDYMFIIGNHVLQKPVGLAPRLAASSRAVKYVKACVDGLMHILWASDGPKSRKEFFSAFPREGFGVVGRETKGKKDPALSSIVFDAARSMLSERLPLHHAKRIILIAPPFVLNNLSTQGFIDEAVMHSMNEVASIEIDNYRPAATILGFGVKPTKQSAERFREFCLELLQARNFETLRETRTVAIGRFGTKSEIAFGFLPSEESLDRLLSSLARAKTRMRCIITNFTPDNPLLRHCEAERIRVFHYSLLDEFMSKNSLARERSS